MNLNMENLNSKTNKAELEERLGLNIGKEISTVKDFKSLRGSTLQSFKDMESAIKLNQNPIKIGNKQLKSAEEIFNAIKDGSLVGKELGRVEKGFLKSSSTSPSLRKAIVVDYVKDANVLKDMSQYGNTRELRKAMSSKGYPKETIDEVISQMKANGKIDKAGNLMIKGGKDTKTTRTVTPPNPKVSAQQTKTIQDHITELRDLVKNKKQKWSKIVKWGAGLGISAIALWWFFSDNSDETAPDDIPEKQPVDPSSLKPCVKALVDSGAGEIFYSNDGSIRVWVRKTGNEEYDKLKGLVFFQNGRVISQDRSKKGSYTCKGSEAVINEQTLSSTEYDIIQAIDTATKGMGTDVAKLKNALSKIKDARTYNNINRQMSDYTAYGSIQSMLQGEMGVANYEDMQQIRRYLAKAGVDVKFRSQTLLGGTVGVKGSTIKLSALTGGDGGQKKSTTTGDLSGIQITWDGDKVTPSPDPDVTPSPSPSPSPAPRPSIYKECKDFPYVFGCISERIAEIQRCLGIQSDGKFGPGTLKAIEKVIMDNSKDAVGVSGRGVVIVNELRTTGISKSMYQEILKHCKVENKPVIKTGNTQTTTTGTTKTDTTKTTTTEPTPKSAETTKGESPADLYARLVKGGYLRGRLRGKRIVYKGPDLSKEDQEKLTKYFEAQGYRISRDNFDKRYGDKYVFKKNNPEEETK